VDARAGREIAMSRSKAYVVLAALLAAGCASTPEIADEAPAAAAVVATTQAPGAVAPSSVVPNAVVDANELVARTPPPVICKEILKPGSNVHVQQCMTADNWKRYQRYEAQNAAELVRMMQGGAYR
jgi:hypothetical protein